MIALTRLPSGRRASTIGDASSTRRPTCETILSMMRSRCASSTKRGVRPLELAGALDVDPVEPVDHDLGHGVVAEERLERAVAEDVVGDARGRAARRSSRVSGVRSSASCSVTARSTRSARSSVSSCLKSSAPSCRDARVVDARLQLGVRVDGAGTVRRARRRRASRWAPSSATALPPLVAAGLLRRSWSPIGYAFASCARTMRFLRCFSAPRLRQTLPSRSHASRARSRQPGSASTAGVPRLTHSGTTRSDGSS